MKAVREDRLESDTGSGGFPTRYLVLLLAIIAVGVFFWQTLKEQPVEVVPEAVVVEAVTPAPPPLPPAQDIPARPEPVVVAEALTQEVEPKPVLPPLEESDPMVREQLAGVGLGPELEPLALQQNIIQQGAALLDGFSRGVVVRKLLPLDPPAKAFSVEERGEQTFMNPAGYARYNDYAEAIASVDSAALVENFHLMRPLYEEAYGQLGLNPEDFDNAVIRMLDRILATPEIEKPIALTRKSVMYQYADPQLEQLTDLQKQLLRMGPDNIRRIKAQARVLRAGLLSQEQ